MQTDANYNLFVECRELIQRLGRPLIQHEFRKRNRAVDLLIQMGSQLPDDQPVDTWMSPPDFAKTLVKEEIHHGSWLWRCNAESNVNASNSSISKVPSYVNIASSNSATPLVIQR